ncbi:MAG: HAMP domain-containing sensor histidine kinase [Eubacteriales bacterium]|nr:HAMP domain-containing sensor histidine kinase [Eubacteriales bacterium]
MLRKMQWRFIWAAMTAFFTVMMVLAVIINIGNFHVTTRRQDQIIEGIFRYEQSEEKAVPDEPQFPDFEYPGMQQPEFEYTTRFFIVRCDLNGNVKDVSKDFIASITEEKAGEYAETLLGEGRISGYYNHYRYHAYETDTEKIVIFLNSDAEYQFMRTLLIISGMVAASSLMIVFFLIFLLSRKAISPYARNIERQKRFITDAGHEIKTPLTSIATSADVLAMIHGEDEWTENIRKQTGRLTKLVGDLITLSRLDEEMPFPEKEEFSLSDAAWESAQPFAALADVQGKQYIQNIAEGLKLYGDRPSVQQMISILLDNAVKYSDEKGEIRFDVYEKHGKRYIEVFNTCQIEDVSDISHLFDRFYRPDSSRSRNTGGTGIGLSIAQAVAEAHGGRIYAESADGRWIRFKAML